MKFCVSFLMIKKKSDVFLSLWYGHIMPKIGLKNQTFAKIILRILKMWIFLFLQKFDFLTQFWALYDHTKETKTHQIFFYH
jgi:hypothetical protein